MTTMKHLTENEIIDFVSMNSINQESIGLAAAVNSHIMQCDECREKVKAFQAVNDLAMDKLVAASEITRTEIKKEEIIKYETES